VSGAELSLGLSVFLACAVEAVEAFTVVLAVGTTRRWSSALAGVGAATLALAVLVGALGPAITSLPIGVLRVVVGGLLLTFGLQWLRKAILRAAGLALRAPLARVPENGMKFVVGVLLTSFGIFWGAEGAGAHWPGGEASLGPLVAVVLLAALAMVRDVRSRAIVPAEVAG
jgi:uncharacterized membrane protein